MHLQEHQGLLTPAQCDVLIRDALKDLSPANIMDGNSRVLSASRVADNVKLKQHPIRDYLIRLLCSRFPYITPEHCEPLEVVRYKAGGRYDPHFDSVSTSETEWERMYGTGGHRLWTLMLYLNDNFRGGKTFFPRHAEKGWVVVPEKGLGVLWSNTTRENKVDRNSLHAALPVTEGVKWIATIWIRERPYKELPV